MSTSKPAQTYTKHFIPLESNPDLFTELIHSLGVPQIYQFHDVYSIDEPELLALIPRPVLALILILPTTPAYEERIAQENAAGITKCNNEGVSWYFQSINNACGLYAILHGVANPGARGELGM
jgi:ubiquitin carboxyl-terminal hydrolase L3